MKRKPWNKCFYAASTDAGTTGPVSKRRAWRIAREGRARGRTLVMRWRGTPDDAGPCTWWWLEGAAVKRKRFR